MLRAVLGRPEQAERDEPAEAGRADVAPPLSAALPGWWPAYRGWRWRNEALRRDFTVSAPCPVAELAPLLDLPVWASAPPERIFDLVPRDVLRDPALHPRHHARILAAELRWPLHAVRLGSARILLDGFHRLARAVLEERGAIEVIEVPLEALA